MAKQNDQTPASEEHVENEVYTNRGNLGLRIGFKNLEYDEDGQDKTRRIIEHLEGSDGTVLGPTDLMRQGTGKTGLATCDKCEEEIHSFFRRTDSKTSLSLNSDMQRCHHCRINLCQKHFYIGIDNQPRCKWCNFWHRMFHALKPFFMRQI